MQAAPRFLRRMCPRMASKDPGAKSQPWSSLHPDSVLTAFRHDLEELLRPTKWTAQAIAPKRVARDLGNASPKRCMACIMFADCITSIADLRVLDDLRVSRGTPPTVEEQNTARFARSDSLAAVEAVARRHGTRKITEN